MPIPAISRGHSRSDLDFWVVRDLKQVAVAALNDWENHEPHYRAVFTPATVMWLIGELERFTEDDLK